MNSKTALWKTPSQKNTEHKNVKKGRKMKNLFHSKHGLTAYKLIIQHREGKSKSP